MALFRRLFYRKPPDHLLEISERVYVFDCCFSTDILEGDEYKDYMDGIVVQLQEHFPESSFMIFNFRERDKESQLYNIFSRYDITVMDCPRQYEKCLLLPLEMINQFLQSCDKWLSLEGQQNILLMHCERGGWPMLAFMLAGLLLYRKQFTGEQKTLEMMYKQASKEILQFLSPINPQPSQLRYLHYISRKTLDDNWPPPDTLVEIDTIILRFLPVFEGGKGCRPVVRVYGKDPSVPATENSKLLFSTANNKVRPRHYVQADCYLVKIDMHCRVKGDVVLECVHFEDDQVHEELMFRSVFHTSFLRSNVLVLGLDEIDVLWDAKDQFPKDFKAEVLFLDADSFVPAQTTEGTTDEFNETGSASPEEFFEVEEIFSNIVDVQDTKGEASTGKDSSEAEGFEKEIWKEEVDPHAFQDCTSEDLNQRQDGKVHPFIPHAVKDIGIDVMHGTQDGKIDQVKDIVIDQWDNKEASAEMIRNKKSKEVFKELYEESGVTRDTLRVDFGDTADKKSDLKVQEPNVISDVGARKAEKILPPALKKPPTFYTKAVVDTVAGKQKIKQQEPSACSSKSPNKAKPSVSRWIPSNKGSYTNSMHVAYPPTRTISAPPSLATPAVPKKTNFLRKGDGSRRSVSHTDLPSIRVTHGSLDSHRFTRTPPSPLPSDEPCSMPPSPLPLDEPCSMAVLSHSGRSSPLVSPAADYRFGVPTLSSNATTPCTEDIPESSSPFPPPPPPATPKSPLSIPSLQSTESSETAPPPPPPPPPPPSPILYGNATQKLIKSPLASPSPSPTSHSLSNQENDGRQVCSPPEPPPAPPWKTGYSCTSSIKTLDDPIIPPQPPSPLPARTVTAPESNIFGPPPPQPPPLPSPSHRHGAPLSQPVERIPSMLLSVTGGAKPPPAPPLPCLVGIPPPPTNEALPPRPSHLPTSVTGGALSPTVTPCSGSLPPPPPLSEAPPPLSRPLPVHGVPQPPPPPSVLGASHPIHPTGRVPPPPPPRPMSEMPPPPSPPISAVLPPPPPPMSAVLTPPPPQPTPMGAVPPPPPPPPPMSTVPPPPPGPVSAVRPPPPPPMSAVRPPPPPPMSAVPPPPPPPMIAVPPPPPPPTSAVPPPPPPPTSAVPPPPPPPTSAVPPPPPPPTSAVPPPPPPPMSAVPPPPPPPMSGARSPPPPMIGGLPPPPPPMSGARPPPPPPISGGPPPPPPPNGKGMPPPPPPLRGPAPPPPPGSAFPTAPRPPGSMAPPPPMGAKGPGPGGLSLGREGVLSRATAVKKSSLKPLHWSKVTRALKGSLWEELQRNGETHIAPEFDVSEIERLFSAVVPKPDKGGDRRKSAGSKSDKVTLVDPRRAHNTEIMLSKVKMPLPDIMAAVLALDESILDIDQVENLIKFCPTKEEMDLLKAYTGDKEKLGKCEQFFLELMKVPRVESKLRVFSFKIQFGTQITDFKKSLNTVNSACEEVRKSLKLKEIMKKVLFLGNTLNNGTARGSAVGFKLDSLLKLYDTRSANSKMTLMHYLCKVLASKSPTLIDFHHDLGSLEVASKIQLKSLAEEMQSISKGLEKVNVELMASESDGPVSDTFRKTLKEFVGSAGTEVASVTELYSVVGRNADGLALYFGEDPARYPFEQVCATIVNFVRLFQKAHDENLKEAEQEKKKLKKEAEAEKAKGTNFSKSDKK